MWIKKTFLLIMSVLFINFVFGQTVDRYLVGTSGETFANSSYQLDWSVGEPAVETFVSGANILTQGFHQTNIEITQEKDDATEINISVYPNPSSNLITVKFGNKQTNLSAIHIKITDITGKILLQSKFDSDEKSFDISDFAQGIYFLSLLQENKTIKVFKIVKK